MIDTKEYLKYIKSQFCLICGATPVDPHHLEAIGMGGSRKKQTPKDFSAIPLCREHHNDYHAMGLKEFNKHWRIDCYKEAFKLLRRYSID